MKKKLLYFKYKTIITVFALLLSVWSWGQNSNNPKVLAQTSDNSSHEFKMTEQNPVEMMKGKKEDISKRDAFSKHFKNEDGSYTALIGAGPIHYRKNGNAYEDIDTKIIKNNDQAFSYANITNLFESYYGAKASHGVKSKTFEGEIREFLDTKMYWEVDGQAVNIQNSVDVTVLIKGDKAYYNNLFGNISAEFIVKSGQRKLNYIIPDKQSLGKIPSNADYLVFTEKIKLPSNFKIVDEYKQYNKLKKEYRNIPGVFIIDSNENVIFEYSAPAIVEDYNPDVMGIPSQILPEISFKKEGDFVILYTKVKADWITGDARIFPVAIDPTATAYPFTTSYSSGQTYSTGGGSGDIAAGYSGGWYRGWATFNLTSVPSLSSVTGATMSLYINSKGGTMGTGSTNINIGHTSFDLSRLVWLNTFSSIYNAITAANNAGGAYNYIPNVNAATWTTVNLKPATSTMAWDEIERKSGNDMAFFPVSFSPSWGTGTTTRYYVIAGYSSTNKPYLSITYTEIDKYKHAAYQYANAGGIGDVGYVQIGNVSVGSINNTTAITNYAAAAATIYRNTPTGYNKYNLSTNVDIGNTYILNATYRDLAPGSNYNSGKIAVWVDWNEDGDFADENEYIGVSANSTSGNQVMSFSITVPSGVSLGTKRLRLRSALSDETITSSSYDTTLEYGETEDYNLVVIAVANPTLTVSGAGTGASYASGSHTIVNNTNITATAGTNPGYLVTGWTGTGSTPATGTGGTANFTITANSTINWQWEQTETPKNIIFYNYGGSEQLAFNNSRIDTTIPVFRMSHGAYEASDYQLEINTAPDFTGTSWTQIFTGTYPVNTEMNFTFTNSFTLVNNTTYYIRARVRGAANVWSSWTTETYSFTYQIPKNVPGWFQTTQAQFQTDVLNGVTADGSNDVVAAAGSGNMIVNGSFEANLNGWTKSSNGSWYSAIRSTDWASDGVASLEMYHNSPGTYGYFVNDYVSMYQTVNLTGVSNLLMEADYAGQGNVIVQLRVYVAETNQATGLLGTLVHTWAPSGNISGSAINIDLTPYAFTGNKVIKIIYYVTGQETTNNMRYLNVDNIRTSTNPLGTITSTPIHYASVQDVTGYDIIRWNQTLGGGTLNLKLQGSADGVIFTDIPGYTAISQTGDGEKTFDISAINPVIYPHLRLEGTLNGAGVKLHDWAVEFKKMEPDCASETKWTSTGWTNGVPDGTGGKKKIIFETDYNSSINPSNSGILIGCSAEIRNTANVTLTSYHNLTIDNEIVVASGASFVLKNDANLLQINNETINQNEGVVKVERLIAESSPLRKEYNYLSSPVIGQNMKRLFGNDVSNTPFTMVLNESTNLFVNAKDVDYQIRAKGFAVKEPKPAYLGTLAEYSGEPINGEFGITVSRAANNRGWNLIGNPYPSGLDLYSLYHSNGNDDVIISEFRFWDNRLNNTYTQYGGNYNGYSYAIYNAATGANGTGNPAPGGDGGNNTGTPNPTTPVDGDFRFVKVGQGFLVRAKNLGTNELNFSNDFRTITKITDGGFFGKSSQIQDDRYRLQLITPDEIVLTNTVVYFEGGNHAFGIEDSKHPSSSSSDTFYSFAEEEKVVINGRNSFTNADIVRLGTSNYLSGTYKIRMMDATGIFPYSQRIYLNDKENHIITDLTEGEYVFYSESGSFTNRFEIIYKPESTLGVTIRNASNVTVYNDNENFVIRSMKPIKGIELYDISGKLMLVLKKSDKEIRIDASRIANGIYILKIVQEDGTESIKKVRK